MKRRYQIIGIFFLFVQFLTAQEQLGIRMDNYSGIDQIWMNPGLAPFSPLILDIHLVGGGLFGENNYGFINQANIFDFTNNAFVTANSLEGRPAPKGYLVSDLYDKPHPKFAQFTSILTGPSIMLKLGQHSGGLFANVRAAVSMTQIPVNLGYYAYNRQPYNETFNLTPFQAAGSSWLETGIHYGYKYEGKDKTISFGTNIKYNIFAESGFFRLKENLPYIKISPDSSTIRNPDVEFGFTSTNINQVNSNDLSDFHPTLQFYGSGISVDFGVVIQKSIGSSKDYQYRFGFSFMDIGVANIKESRVHASRPIPAEITLDFAQLKNASTIQQLERKLSGLALGDSTASLKAHSFKLGMPTSIGIQGDYRLTQNIYIGGMLIQSLGLSKYNLTRPSVLAFSPRYERRFFSISMPLVLRNWDSMRMGFAVRLAYLSLGTDNLGSIITKKDFTGTDLYFSLRFNITNWKNKKIKSKRRRGRRKSKLGCYDF